MPCSSAPRPGSTASRRNRHLQTTSANPLGGAPREAVRGWRATRARSRAVRGRLSTYFRERSVRRSVLGRRARDRRCEYTLNARTQRPSGKTCLRWSGVSVEADVVCRAALRVRRRWLPRRHVPEVSRRDVSWWREVWVQEPDRALRRGDGGVAMAARRRRRSPRSVSRTTIDRT
jgi:hypothetical protein